MDILLPLLIKLVIMQKLIVLVFMLLGCKTLLADLVISEFMAVNTTTLKDGHDNYEDWIEIWNPDATAVDLGGWRLTDSTNNLSKFTFPSRILPAGGRMVVFCSGRAGSSGAATHIDPLGYLHTNFSLSKSGEYLALIKPDGTTKTSEFAPAYAQQVSDISYGSRGTSETLIDEKSPVRYVAPVSGSSDTASINWRAIAFSDASWRSGTGSGLGFEIVVA